MADNTVLNSGAGGDTIRDVNKTGAIKTPVSLIDIGGAGAEALLTAGQAAMANSVPVAIANNQSAVPVSGTVTANAGTGNFSITAASLPLPTGASTSAKQPALGTAGSASTDVLSVQGIASMTPLKVDGSAVTQPISGTVSITADSLINLDQIHGTAADANSGLKSNGTLRVVLATDQPQLTNKILVTPDSVALPANQSINISQLAGTTTDTNSGAKSAGTLRVVLATDQPALTNALKVDGSAVTQPISGNVGLTPQTSGGLSISRTLSANNTTGISVKGSAGQVFSWSITNTNAAARWVKIYNKATAPTVGTDTPVITLIVPGNGTVGGGNNFHDSNGIAFATGIGLGITTGVADADTGAPAVNEVVVNLFYK